MRTIQSESGRRTRRAYMLALGVAASVPLTTAAGQAGAQAAISHVDPCSLLKTDEIQQQIELSMGSKLEGLRKQGVTWSIAMQPDPRGASRACQISWQGKAKGEVYSRGEFSVVVTFASWLTGSVAGMTHPLPIPNLGDEAYFVGGKSGPPYARIGDMAIGIENFPDTKQAKAGVDLLRSAVSRASAMTRGAK